MNLKVILFVFGLMSHVALASPITTDNLTSGDTSVGITINSGRAVITVPTGTEASTMLTTKNTATVSNKTYDESTNVKKECRALYDFASAGGSTMVSLGCAFPANSVIIGGWMDISTTFATSSGANVALGLAPSNPTTGDLMTMQMVPNLTSGLYQLNPRGTSSTIFKVTAATTGYLKVSSGTLTAGKAQIFIDYLISQ